MNSSDIIDYTNEVIKRHEMEPTPELKNLIYDVIITKEEEKNELKKELEKIKNKL